MVYAMETVLRVPSAGFVMMALLIVLEIVMDDCVWIFVIFVEETTAHAPSTRPAPLFQNAMAVLRRAVTVMTLATIMEIAAKT